MKFSNSLSKNNYNNDPLISILKNKNVKYKCGELGCILSHYFLLREIALDDMLNNDSVIFIFEDDFFLHNKYLKINPLKKIIEQELGK